MDLMCFKGKIAFIDLTDTSELLVAVETNISISLNQQAIYESIFNAIDSLDTLEEELEPSILDIPFYGGIDEDDICLCDNKDIELFREICKQVARSLCEQLKSHGYYKDGVLTMSFKGCYSKSTGILFEKVAPWKMINW